MTTFLELELPCFLPPLILCVIALLHAIRLSAEDHYRRGYEDGKRRIMCIIKDMEEANKPPTEQYHKYYNHTQ